MHPAAESFVYAGVLPAMLCGAIVVCGCALGITLLDKTGWLTALASGAVGLCAALALANWSRGLVEWTPGDSLDWILWTPPLLAVASAGIYAARGRWPLAAALGIAFTLLCAWLVTPSRESLGAHRWLWLGLTAGGTLWLWLVSGLALVRRAWTASLLLTLSCCLEAVLLALSWSLRLADLATVGAAVMGSGALLPLILPSDRARPLVQAALFAQLVGTSLLLASVAVYGAMENFSDTPDFAFYLPLVIPAVALMPWRRRTDAAAEAA